jgi:Predicted hydrolases or acyltransferases (alpha/beta hydrolase superfamily)
MEHYVNNGQVKLWTDKTGDSKGNCVMLCNGGPGCADYLEPVAQMIDDMAQVIRFEQRACGRSAIDYNCDVETTVSDLECMREFYGISKWIVGGHSWGANLALAYALKYPENTKAILYISGNGIQRNREWSEIYHKNKAEFGEQMPEIKYEANEEVNKLGNRSWQEYIQHPALLKRISELNIPALFVYGSQDIRPSWPAEQIAQLMPKARFVMIDGAAHYIWLTHDKELRVILREYLPDFLEY